MKHSYLNYLLISYLLLGGVDTVHHLHAAVALGQNNAMHAVWIDVVLILIAILSLLGFIKYGKRILLWVFSLIAALAIILPGLYHGGWDHLVKVLAFLRVEGESTKIESLFPSDNFHLWFYELSGVLEFFLAIIATYFLYKVVRTRR